MEISVEGRKKEEGETGGIRSLCLGLQGLRCFTPEVSSIC